MQNLNPEQHDTGTRLATPSPRRPFSECNKGNRRRLHAGYASSKMGIIYNKVSPSLNKVCLFCFFCFNKHKWDDIRGNKPKICDDKPQDTMVFGIIINVRLCVYLPFSQLIFPMALNACKTTFGSSLSRCDKMAEISPAFTHGTLVSSKTKTTQRICSKKIYSLKVS